MKIAGHQSLPHQTLYWLLAATVSVLLPHAGRMPLWLTALCLICLGYRVLIHQGRLSYPGRLLKGTVVVVILMGVVAQFGRDALSPEATVGLLIAGVSLKLLEMHRRRDVLIIIYLCYFAAVAQFIYSQSIPVALYMLMATTIITSALISSSQTAVQRPARTFRLSTMMLAQSAPLMLVLFLLFPRVSPLWSVPVQSSGGTTGLSETMSPGDIGNLTRSDQVAFRVRFEDRVPPNEMLYWRALTLDLFDGREWSSPRASYTSSRQYLGSRADELQDWYAAIRYRGDPVIYNVIAEPSRQRWLYTLKMPRINRDGLVMLENYQVQSLRPVTQRMSYDVRSYPQSETQDHLSEGVARRALMLPREGNDRSRRWAVARRESAGSDAAYLEAVLTHFREAPFHYSLDPPRLGEDVIDAFLFDTREGFCEHYAGAFTYLMRAAGIPSRVVTGYQGGELNPYDETLIVRQYDAHAWSEVWLAGQGWIRVDPTAAVAPERITLGSGELFGSAQRFSGDGGFSMLQFRNNRLLNALRLRLETIDYAWNRWVLNYDQDTQFALLSALFGRVTRVTAALLIVAGLGTLLVLAALLLLRMPRSRKTIPAVRDYQRLCRHLAALGYPRARGEGPWDYCQRIAGEQPAWAAPLARITSLYVDLVYGSPAAGADSERQVDAQTLRREIRHFALHT